MKWEYLTAKVCVPHSIPDTAILRGAGLEGWELVSVDNGVAYFKRPLRTKSEDEIMKHFEGRQSLV